MNCPSKTDPLPDDDWNQSPNALANDLTTRSDFGQIANARLQRDHRLENRDSSNIALAELDQTAEDGGGGGTLKSMASHGTVVELALKTSGVSEATSAAPPGPFRRSGRIPSIPHILHRCGHVLKKYAQFVGPGFMISVAYIDPGNYATDVAAGASYRFRLLFMVLLSNCFAIFLQSLCIKLGSVTGLNLAEMIKAHLPRWLNYVLYFLAESAIIATDIAEVIGTAIALNLLLKIPLVAGVAISIVDVLVILIFYNPSGTVRGLRAFELFVVLLVMGVVICFCFQLSLVKGVAAGEVFRGYLPSAALVQGTGLYQSCGILGATVMPHSLFLGSGIIQTRLKDFDMANHTLPSPSAGPDEPEEKYKPSIFAIRSCMPYSIAELAISLFTFAMFVNSAILIVAGGSLSDRLGADGADLFGIHDLLSQTLAPIAGTIFALALLFSGTSAGIVCTIAGQMISEGQLNWSVRPWIRRLITRLISILPSIVIAGALGADGVSAALNGSQVALSVLLPFLSAPLIYFTCRNKYMTVASTVGPSGSDVRQGDGGGGVTPTGPVKMRNSRLTAAFAVVIWLCIVVMNVALIVLVARGLD